MEMYTTTQEGVYLRAFTIAKETTSQECVFEL